MPRRNTIRIDEPERFYHVFVRGLGRRRIFVDEQDYLYFLHLFERYLAPDESQSRYGVSYPNFYNKAELAAYCLMPGNFHLLVYQRHTGALSSLMRSLMTSYSRYYNTRYKRTGSMFESRYRSALISDDSYLPHVTRFIHLIPKQWQTYEYSSLPYYLQQVQVSWVDTKRIARVLSEPQQYVRFMENRGDYKRMHDILKLELASEMQ